MPLKIFSRVVAFPKDPQATRTYISTHKLVCAMHAWLYWCTMRMHTCLGTSYIRKWWYACKPHKLVKQAPSTGKTPQNRWTHFWSVRVKSGCHEIHEIKTYVKILAYTVHGCDSFRRNKERGCPAWYYRSFKVEYL